jgi:hypothetical protein
MSNRVTPIIQTPLVHHGETVEYVGTEQGKKALRCVVLHRAVGNLKLALCGSDQVPEEVQNYVRYCLESATTTNMDAVMHFFDIYNHHKRFMHPNKRRYVINIWNAMKTIFDGTMPDDPEFDSSDAEDNLTSLWLTVKAKRNENADWVADTRLVVTLEETMEDDEESIDEDRSLGSEDTWDQDEDDAIRWMHGGIYNRN